MLVTRSSPLSDVSLVLVVLITWVSQCKAIKKLKNLRRRDMVRWGVHSLILVFFHLGFALCQGPAKEVNKLAAHRQSPFFKSTSTRQMDITTPITTIPTLDPVPSATPVLNPTISNPHSPASTTTTTSPAASAIRSWCIASQSASKTTLQVALDYACGYGGANCSAIQPSGGCYNPNTLHNHASYAFNNYYQKNPVPNSCTFGGTGVTTSTDPSSSTCQYPSASTSSSVLNISDSNGSTVFGAGPINPSSLATTVASKHSVFIYVSLHYLSLCWLKST